MFKRIATIVLVVASVGSNLFAQAKPGGFARQAAMGGSQFSAGVVLNPYIVDDPALMYVNPAYQTMYKDYAWSNIGGGQLLGASTGNNGYGQQTAGINFSLSKELTVGALLSHDPSAANVVSGIIGGTIGGVAIGSLVRGRPVQTIPAIANVWEAVGSYDAGALDLGFGIMYGSSNIDSMASIAAPVVSSFEREASSSVFGVRGGVNFDLGGGSSFDGSAALRLDKATDLIKSTTAGTAANLGEYSASGTEIQVEIRLRLKMSNKVNFSPFGTFALLSAEPKEDAPPTGLQPLTRTIDVSALAYAIGVGGEYRTPSVYLAGGLSYQFARTKAEVADTGVIGTTTATASFTSLPLINLGGEYWFTDWLAGRAGYFRAVGSLKIEIEARNITFESNRTLPHSFIILGGLNPATWDGVVTLGIGLKFGNFALDATISEEALRRGLGLLGSGDNINTFGYLAGSYNFQ